MTSTFVIDGVPGRLATTATSNGELGHVDLRAGTHNSTLAGLTDALSCAITTALRAGAPPATFVDAFRRTHYVPAGTTGDPDVPYATSLGDYLAQRLHHNHLDGAERL
ncbi:hypothetical protein F6X68_31415 [Micromonospora sp. AMSO12t]|uniref:TSCPD domain-containing protein n=1 Tax=unclassified Micromonospora TaxID=2617518 RepID=UPI00124B1C3F|nr:hypothetical protein [Micromonospora sp. AMSO12t]KAB1128482.1 hypothetical protein F6X68_31415 [Micromonospora sp. AMSO12t]